MIDDEVWQVHEANILEMGAKLVALEERLAEAETQILQMQLKEALL